MPWLRVQKENKPQKPFKNLQRLSRRCCKSRVRKSERAEEEEEGEREESGRPERTHAVNTGRKYEIIIWYNNMTAALHLKI